MSSLRIVNLPLGGGPPSEEPAVSLVVDWVKDGGYETGLVTAARDGTSVMAERSRHGTAKDALIAAVDTLEEWDRERA